MQKNHKMHDKYILVTFKLIFTYSKSTTETLEKGVEYGQS